MYNGTNQTSFMREIIIAFVCPLAYVLLAPLKYNTYASKIIAVVKVYYNTIFFKGKIIISKAKTEIAFILF